MKSIQKILIAAFLTATIAGCAVTKVPILRPEIKSSVLRISRLETGLTPSIESATDSSYEDSLISMTAMLTTYGIILEIFNKTNRTIFIDWNSASFEDPDKFGHRIFHGDVKVINREEAQVRTPIGPGGRIRDMVAPIENAFYRHNIGFFDDFYTWTLGPLLPVGWSNYSLIGREISVWQGWEEQCRKYLGQSVKLFLPIEFGESAHTYSLVFSIDNVSATKAKA